MSARKGRSIGKLLVCLAGVGFSLAAQAQTFTKIADLMTPIPGGTGAFTELTQPQISLGDIVFGGAGNNAQHGIYRFNFANSSITPLVDQNTILPGASPGRLLGTSFAVYGPDVSFLGQYQTPSFDIRMLSMRGGMRVIADPPHDPWTLDAPNGPLAMDDQLYLHFALVPKFGIGPEMINSFRAFRDDGSHAALNPNNVIVQKYITRKASPAISGQGWYAGKLTAFFLGASAGGGFGFSDGAEGGEMMFPTFWLPGEPSFGYTLAGGSVLFSDDGDTVAFRAGASRDGVNITRTAILTKRASSPLRVAVDTNTVAPGAAGARFASFSDLTIDGYYLAFIGTPSSELPGIYGLEGDGTLHHVISYGETLDGKTVSGLSFSGDRPLSGFRLAFTAQFTDGSKGLFVTQVPEPGVITLATACLMLLPRRRRR